MPGSRFSSFRLRPCRGYSPLLKEKLQFDYLVDLTAVDYPKRAERFDLIYILYSFESNRRIRLKSTVAEGAAPASLTPLFKAANWLEREVYRHVRHRLCRPSQPETHPDAGGVGGPPAAQGLLDHSTGPGLGAEHLEIESGQ